MKGWGLLAGLLALAAVVGGLFGLGIRYHEQNVEVAGWRGCAAAVAHGRGALPVAEACQAQDARPIAEAALTAERAGSCDTALLAEDLYAVRASCSTAVKTLQAQRDAARVERDGLASDITRLRADQAGAIARAEARARRESERSTHAQAALAAAPRDPDGRVRCGAECLRALDGSGATASPG